MPFESDKQRAFLHKNKPEVAEKFKKHMRGRRRRKMQNPGGGFAAAAQRRLDMGKSISPGLRKVKPMASGRAISMPSTGRRAQPMPATPTAGVTRKAQPFKPGDMPSKMPAFQAAARRRLAAK